MDEKEWCIVARNGHPSILPGERTGRKDKKKTNHQTEQGDPKGEINVLRMTVRTLAMPLISLALKLCDSGPAPKAGSYVVVDRLMRARNRSSDSTATALTSRMKTRERGGGARRGQAHTHARAQPPPPPPPPR